MKHYTEYPRVSVIVPNYNHAAFLPERLQSILQQTFQDFELIVLDDASSDDSVAIIREILSGSPYRLVVNDSNSGSPFQQWSRGIALAKGQFVWLAESDDAADPAFLENLVPRLTEPDITLTYAQSLYIDADSQIECSAIHWTNDLSQSLWQQDFTLSGRYFAQNFLAVKAIMPNASAVLFRRSFSAGFEQRIAGFQLCGDWMFWHHLCLQGRVSFVAQPLNHFRSHGQTVRKRKDDVFLKEMIQVASTILSNDDDMPTQSGREQLLHNLLAFWRHWGFSLSSPRCWREHRQGFKLLIRIARSRKRIAWMMLRDALSTARPSWPRSLAPSQSA